jgi:hypothetical protein
MAFQQVDLGSDECGMSSLPDKVEIPLATVRDATAFYIVKTATPDGRRCLFCHYMYCCALNSTVG